jgi:hypothetical protein
LEQQEMQRKAIIKEQKLEEVLEEASKKMESRKALIMEKQKKAEDRLKKYKEDKKKQEMLKKEMFELQTNAKRFNTERVKKINEYNIQKIKERIETDEKRKQRMMNRSNGIKQMRLKNMQESELLRDRVREALYQMAVWNVVDMNIVEDIINSKGNDNTIEDKIRKRVCASTSYNPQNQRRNYRKIGNFTARDSEDPNLNPDNKSVQPEIAGEQLDEVENNAKPQHELIETKENAEIAPNPGHAESQPANEEVKHEEPKSDEPKAVEPKAEEADDAYANDYEKDEDENKESPPKQTTATLP